MRKEGRGPGKVVGNLQRGGLQNRQGDGGRIFRFERYDIANERGYGVMVQAFDGARLTHSIRADEMRWGGVTSMRLMGAGTCTR